MFQELHNQMIALATSSQAMGLFTSFTDDLYKHDLDIVLHDMKCGDRWLWVIKQCGSYLTLVTPGNEYLETIVSSALRDGADRRYFIISVLQDRCDIAEVPVAGLAQTVKSLPYIKDRVPSRQFAYSLLVNSFPSLKGSIMFSDHSFEKGAELYLSVTANSLTYVSAVSNKNRTLPLPFDFNRTSGYMKLTVTSEFGHGNLEDINGKVFNHALKKTIKRAA